MLMNDGYIRNGQGRILGKWDKHWLRDSTGKLVARHDEWDNRTRDGAGKILGNGDQRLRALRKNGRAE